MGEVVTTSMFLVNQHPAIVLFDSGALHSFMSHTFASKHNQKIVEVDKGSYSISSARATISTNQIVIDGSHSIARISHRCDIRQELDEWSWSSH